MYQEVYSVLVFILGKQLGLLLYYVVKNGCSRFVRNTKVMMRVVAINRKWQWAKNMMRVVTMIAITIIMMMMKLTDNGSGPNVWVGLRVTLILSLLCI